MSKVDSDPYLSLVPILRFAWMLATGSPWIPSLSSNRYQFLWGQWWPSCHLSCCHPPSLSHQDRVPAGTAGGRKDVCCLCFRAVAMWWGLPTWLVDQEAERTARIRGQIVFKGHPWWPTSTRQAPHRKAQQPSNSTTHWGPRAEDSLWGPFQIQTATPQRPDSKSATQP